MVKKKTDKKAELTSSVKPKPNMIPPNVKNSRRLTNENLRELMVKNKPLQSWYEEDHMGLY